MIALRLVGWEEEWAEWKGKGYDEKGFAARDNHICKAGENELDLIIKQIKRSIVVVSYVCLAFINRISLFKEKLFDMEIYAIIDVSINSHVTLFRPKSYISITREAFCKYTFQHSPKENLISQVC